MVIFCETLQNSSSGICTKYTSTRISFVVRRFLEIVSENHISNIQIEFVFTRLDSKGSGIVF